MSKYKITVLTIQGRPLTFSVEKYEVVDGDFVTFTDNKTGRIKKFHASRCEIAEGEYGF